MRVLVVHNRYSSRVPSGENLAVHDEVGWLRDAGVDVETHEVSNDDVVGAGTVDRVRQAAESLWSISAQRRMAAAIDAVRPDIVHVHNLFPLLTASVPWTAGRRGIPVLWTVHNHRVVCVVGTHFRDGAPCHLCRPGWRVPGVRHGCYGGSAVASGLVTGSTSMFARLARRRITTLAVSNHMKRWLVDDAGFSPARVRVKYNGVALPPDGTTNQAVSSSRAFFFSGHLTEHKGVELLLQAWQRVGADAQATLLVAGDGPRAGDIRGAAAADDRITWLGHVRPDQMASHLSAARAAIVPSTWEEPFGRTAAEALAYGRPVITTGSGGLTEVVDETSGWITAGDPDRLAAAIREAAGSDEAVEKRSPAARARHAELFSPQATTDALIRIYEEASSGAVVPKAQGAS